MLSKMGRDRAGEKSLGGRVFLSQLCSQFQDGTVWLSSPSRPGCLDPDADAGQESPAEEMGRVDEKGWRGGGRRD